ncbi:SRPBCC family protein [Pontibaca salina]|uniref:SRPBCC family protein n=1 Tax=Pontibaca salina TaxID=2795731 RepID=A0A934HNN2_9RHOB|nr:SRPBCC family protein [Pontibaca salina]MBI6630331.1 SRPBCC family protein [Pontibaca salina]
MRFSSREDIDASVNRVFRMLADFETYERFAMRRGIEVCRVDPAAPEGVGLAWDVRYHLRGRDRDARLDLVECDPLDGLRVISTSEGVDATMQINLLALSRRRTRMAVSLKLVPTTFSARVFVQSLKVAKSSLSKRFKLKVAEYAKSTEDQLMRVR